MRKAMITTFALLLAGGSAWAQSSYDEQGRDHRGSESYRSQGYDSDRSSRSARWRDNDQHASRHYDEDMHNYSQSGGARFYFKSGDHEFRIRCGGGDTTRECVDAALTMFREITDSARPLRTGGSSSAPGGSSGSVTPGAAGAAKTGESATGR